MIYAVLLLYRTCLHFIVIRVQIYLLVQLLFCSFCFPSYVGRRLIIFITSVPTQFSCHILNFTRDVLVMSYFDQHDTLPLASFVLTIWIWTRIVHIRVYITMFKTMSISTSTPRPRHVRVYISISMSMSISTSSSTSTSTSTSCPCVHVRVPRPCLHVRIPCPCPYFRLRVPKYGTCPCPTPCLFI